MAKTKTDNFSIRFEPAKLELIQKQEKIDTPQRVVNFLMDKYWWEHIIGNNPIMERIAENNKPENKAKIEAIRNTISEVSKTAQNPLPSSEAISIEKRDIMDRLRQLETELKNPPANPVIGAKRWILARELEIEQLKNKL